MKTAMMLLMVWSGAAMGGETNLTSFTNLAGKVWSDVRIVATNKDGIVFKEAGKLGFQSEKLTNLPGALRAMWKPKAEPEKKAGPRDSEFVAALKGAVRDAILSPVADIRNRHLKDLRAIAEREMERLDRNKTEIELNALKGLAPLGERELSAVEKRAKDAEEAKVWDDYIQDRIRSTEHANKLLEIEIKYAIIKGKKKQVYAAREKLGEALMERAGMAVENELLAIRYQIRAINDILAASGEHTEDGMGRARR